MSLRELMAKTLGCNLDGSIEIDQEIDTDCSCHRSFPKQYKRIKMTMLDDQLDNVLKTVNDWLESKRNFPLSRTPDSIQISDLQAECSSLSENHSTGEKK
jgi:Holliday junction resolvase RusA-like endonuclease